MTEQQDQFLDLAGSQILKFLQQYFKDMLADDIEGTGHSAEIWTFGIDRPVHRGSIVLQSTQRPCAIIVSREHIVIATEGPRGPHCVSCLWLNWIAVQGGAAHLSRAGVARSAPADPVPSIAEGVLSIAAVVVLSAVNSRSPFDIYIDLDDSLIHSAVLSASAWCDEHESVSRPTPDETSPSLKNEACEDRLAPPPRADLAATCSPVGGTAASAATEMLDGITASVTGTFTESDDHFFTSFSWGGHAATYSKALDTGVVEAHERLATLRRPSSSEFIMTSLAELGEEGFDPRSLGEYSPEVYKNDPTIEPFDVNRKVNWIPGRSLVSGKRIWVPVSSVFFYADRGQKGPALASSSGCATGATLVEATLHALLELVERDAFLSAWYGGRRLPELAIPGIVSLELARLGAKIKLSGHGLRILDATSEFGVPVVVAIAERLSTGWGSTTFGAGASLNPELAALAAVKEAAFRIYGFEEASLASRSKLDAMVDDYAKVISLGDHARLYGHPEMKSRVGDALGWLNNSDSDFARGETSALDVSRVLSDIDMSRELSKIVQSVERVSGEIIVVDVSLNTTNNALRTARVIAPGLLPLDFGWAKQRAFRSPRLSGRVSDFSSLVPHPFP